MDQAPSTDHREVRSVKPLLYALAVLGGYETAYAADHIRSASLIPPPYHFLKDTPPSPATQSLYLLPLLGREPLMYNLRLRVLCLPQLYCTTHRIRINWDETGRQVLSVDLLLGDHQNPAFRFYSCPDFIHVASYQDELRWSGRRIPYVCDPGIGARKLPSGWHRVGENPAYKHRLQDGKALILRFRGDESFCFR